MDESAEISTAPLPALIAWVLTDELFPDAISLTSPPPLAIGPDTVMLPPPEFRSTRPAVVIALVVIEPRVATPTLAPVSVFMLMKWLLLGPTSAPVRLIAPEPALSESWLALI